MLNNKIELYDDLRFKLKYPNFKLLEKYYEITKLNIESKLKEDFYHDFINFCLLNLEHIKSLNLNFKNHFENKLNVVMVEFREYPHIEYIIRNNMLLLKEKGNYTCVCGNINYNMIKNFNIPNLNIIKLDYNIVSRGLYSQILASKKFWQLFNEEYILITQWDSIIFNSNIEDFYGFDFIGSPFCKPKEKHQLFQGNGGFSLRKREKMLNIIDKYDILKMTKNLKPIRFMTKSDENICPEDVYFNQYLLYEKNSSLPPYEKCIEFSSESSKLNSFGGHKFFKKQNWKTLLKFKKPFINNNLLNGNFNIFKIKNFNEICITNNDFIIKDIFSHSNESIEKFFNSFDLNNIDFLEKKNIKKLDNVLVYNNRYDFNWRHFLTETFFYLKDVYNRNDITILISKKIPYIIEIFNILEIKNYLILDDNLLIKCKNLIIPSNDKQLEDKFLKYFINKCNLIAQKNEIKYFQNIFLIRKNNNKNYRYVYNQDLLNKELLNKNYYFLEGGTIPLYQQISLINNAKNIITQIGANCDNILFTNELCEFKIIYPRHCERWVKLYSKKFKNCIKICCGNNFTKNENLDKYNWNYEIDFNNLKL